MKASGSDLDLMAVELVMDVLERLGVPLTRIQLGRELARAGYHISAAQLDRALSFFLTLGFAVEGSKGVQWTHGTHRV